GALCIRQMENPMFDHQKKLLIRGLLIAGIVIPGVSVANGPIANGPVIHAARTTAPISLDGRLNESAWRHAGMIRRLSQAEPHPGEPTPFKTTVRVLRDADHLYFGIVARDPKPARISTHTLKRDGGLD